MRGKRVSDILIRGGRVIDGGGGPSRRADVVVREGRIEAVGDFTDSGAELVLEAAGLVVAPGFIDCHSHSDSDLLEDPLARPKVAQGVTTEVVGNCGWGPYGPEEEALGGRGFGSLGEYRAALKERGTAVNVAALVPDGPVRLSVVGPEDRAATGEELRGMGVRVREWMGQGAAGMSFGLLYAPGCFTPTEEIVALARVVGEFGRPVAFHVRNECDRFAESVAEALAVGRAAGAAVHISHLKVADPEHWGRVGVVLEQIEEAAARGETVTCDQYPYTAGSAPFETLLPPWSLAGGKQALLGRLREVSVRERVVRCLEGKEEVEGWDNLSRRIGWERIVVASAPGREAWEGRSVGEIAAERREGPAEVLFELMLVTETKAQGIFHHMCEEDVQAVMRHPAQMVGSDGLPSSGKPHPRLWGTFPRVLGRYCRELGLLGLEEAVHKMTGKTALTFGLEGRGRVAAGGHADLCVFDAERVSDRATYEDPVRAPEGIVHVICNGVPTMLDGERTEARPGEWAVT